MKKTHIFLLFIVLSSLAISFNHANASDNTENICNANKSVNLGTFRQQRSYQIYGTAKNAIIEKALKSEKTQQFFDGKENIQPQESAVYETIGYDGSKKHTAAIVLKDIVITYIIATQNGIIYEYVSAEKNNFENMRKRDQYDDQWLDVIGGYVPRPDDIDNVSCTGCAGTGESQEGRTAKATEMKIDDKCFSSQYQSCAGDPNCDSEGCLAACYAGSKAYCSYSEAYCRKCVYIPTYTEHMGNMIW